jgi:hypothetical protein
MDGALRVAEKIEGKQETNKGDTKQSRVDKCADDCDDRADDQDRKPFFCNRDANLISPLFP